jgi:hypothetical protein
VKSEDEWSEDVKRLLRAEMARRDITYEQLSEKLAAIGIADSAVNIRNKVARGKFTARFLFNAWRQSASARCASQVMRQMQITRRPDVDAGKDCWYRIARGSVSTAG